MSLMQQIGPLVRPIGEPVVRWMYSWEKPEQIATRSTALAHRLRRLLYPAGNAAERLVEFEEGLKFWVNLSEFEGGNLYFGLPFEESELALFRRLVEPGHTVLDVGSNLGIYTSVASRRVGETGAVHAFEPAPYAGSLLERNVALNHLANVTVHRHAVGEERGVAEMYVNRESVLSSLGRTQRGEVVRIEQVAVHTIDDVVAEQGIGRVDVLKVDVEGFEGHVLRGAAKLIEGSADLAVVCELAEKNFAPMGVSVKEVLAWMLEREYEAWIIGPRDLSLTRLLDLDPPYHGHNFLFVRPGSLPHRHALGLAGAGWVVR